MRRLASRFLDSMIDRVHPPRTLGQRGERLAARHLRDAGYRIVGRNWTGRTGEIDIIATRGRCVIFVEVKTRMGDSHETALLAVDGRKQRQIARAASEWWQSHHKAGWSLRFDVVAVAIDTANRVSIKHVEHAFESPL